MYFGDHNPPHFHIVTPDEEALVGLETLEVFEGSVRPTTLAAARAWASQNTELLAAKWLELHAM